MATVGVLGTFDTKGDDYAWVRSRLRELGVDAWLIDVGSFSHSPMADVTSDEVMAAAGMDPAELRGRADRGEMMKAMGVGAAAIAKGLAANGAIDGLFAMGGSGGSSVAAAAMQALPVGFPKLLVSTMASGNVAPYVGEVDTTLMYSVVDVAGINSVSAQVLDNAAAAIAGMAKAYEARREVVGDHRPLIAITMFGVTTPAADEARERLTELGYEVLVFHATGTGGRAMEKLVESGLITGVVDLTTTELCDELAGGILSAGPHRLEMAGAKGVPQVVSLGALDMVNFGALDTVPSKYKDRNLFVHNPTITLMRTTPEEMASLGAEIATKLRAATGPTALYIPLRGVSAIDVEGAPFYDPAADEACNAAIRAGLAGSSVVLVERDLAINDPGFGREMADALHAQITTEGSKGHEAQ